MFNWIRSFIDDQEKNSDERQSQTAPTTNKSPSSETETDVDDLFEESGIEPPDHSPSLTKHNDPITMRVVDIKRSDTGNMEAMRANFVRDVEAQLIVRAGGEILVEYESNTNWLPVSKLKWDGDLGKESVVYTPQWLIDEDKVK